MRIADRQNLIRALRAPTLEEARSGRRLDRAIERCPHLAGRVWQPFGEQFEAGLELRRQMHSFAVSLTHPDPSQFTTVSTVLWAKAYSTYEATLRLCLEGYGEQALILARTSLETMLDHYWAANNQAIAANSFMEHAAYWNQQLDNKRQKVGLPSLLKRPIFEADEMKVLGRKYGRSWTALSIEQRVTRATDPDLEYPLPEDEPGQLAEIQAQWVQHINLTTHTSAQAAAAVAEIEFPREEFEVNPGLVQVGGDVRAVPPALRLAGWCVYRSTRVYADLSGGSCGGVDSAAEAVRLAGVSVPASVASKTGRNDACPCGRGVKFKRCHGRDEIDDQDLALAFSIHRDQRWEAFLET